jgi:hypothetical protein
MSESTLPKIHYHADAQRHVLGAALASPEARKFVLARLADGDVFGDGDRRILRAIRELETAGMCSVVTVAERLPKQSDEVHDLFDRLPSIADVSLSVDVVKRDATKRALEEKLTGAHASLAAGNGDLAITAAILRDAVAVAEQPSEGGRPQLHSYTAPEIIGMEFPEPDPVVLYAERGCLFDLVGKAKKGKTTFILLGCKAVLRGEPFLDLPTKRVLILYLTEQTRRSFRDKLLTTGLAQEADLHVLFRTDFKGKSWNEVCEVIRDEIAKWDFGLVVIDTLSDWARIQDENDNAEALRVTAPLREIAESGVAIITARHAGKGEHGGLDVVDVGRGGSAFAGVADTLCVLEGAPGSGHPNRRQLRFESRKDDIPPTMIVELKDGHYDCLGNAPNVEYRVARDFVLEHLRGDEAAAISEKEILDACHGRFSRSTLQRVLNGLTGEGIATGKRGAGSASDKAFGYWLLDDESGGF